MVSAVPLASPAGAQVPASRTISEFACPTAEVPEDNFADVPTTNTHEAAIDCVAWYGVTTGTSANFYSPGQPVPREQMASFIARLIDYIAARTPSTTDGLPAAPATNAFPCDVSTGSTHHASIQRLAAADVVEGKGTNGSGQACFQPGELVTRAQMATFIAKAQRVLDQDVPTTSTFDYYGDDNGNTHEANINAITAERISTGVGGSQVNGKDRYAPDADVTRDQMASFLARKLDRLIDRTEAVPPGTATIAPTSANIVGGGNYEGTITASRGTIDNATVTGCRISPAAVFDVENAAGAATLPISVTIPASNAGTMCRLDVVVNFVGGGRFTVRAVINVLRS